MTSKPKSQNNPNPQINSSAKPISPQKKQEETLKLPTHHPSVVSLESNVKLEDKPSCPYNSHTKHTKKCLVWCKRNNVKTQAKIHPIKDLNENELLDFRKPHFRAGLRSI